MEKRKSQDTVIITNEELVQQTTTKAGFFKFMKTLKEMLLSIIYFSILVISFITILRVEVMFVAYALTNH